MKRNGSSGNNYIRATLIKIKFPNDTILNSFILRMEFNNQTQETEKLTGKENEIKKVYIIFLIIIIVYVF